LGVLKSLQQKAQATNTAAKIEFSQLSVEKDPVCNMSMKEHSITDTMSYGGKVYGFCNPGCKDEFKKEPAKYLSNK